ncbi:MAG: archaemetzincin family Zn-dependent metalloprotease [Bacteroidales bacterium]|nr:archaemetzincin family Zn-dependent metalloprotease [Bacteroidales bacterium]
MDQQYICILTFGYFEMSFLEKIERAIRNEFFLPVRFRAAHFDLSETYDIVRRQYNGNNLLKEVDAMAYPNAIKTIGLFNVDIFVPILTFIFGQATLDGQSGIASLFRLNNTHYGLPEDEDLLLERFQKEVIHELGHTFGLLHCHAPQCVMRSSTYVEDIDQKETHFCMECRNKLNTTAFIATTFRKH